MFFGRENELLRLTNDLRTHFALVGPGRIGKSSLLKQYCWQMRQARAGQLVWLSAYGFGDQSPDFCAREIALQVSSSNEAYRVNVSTLPKFLRRQAAILKRPLDLLIDECDEICGHPVLEYLGEAAKEGYVRLILFGREKLFVYWRSGSSSFGLRLELIKLGPLAVPAAVELLRIPMMVLGLSFDSEDCLEHCCHMAGRMPDLLQFYGRGLVQAAAASQQTQLSRELIRKVEDDAAISLVGSHVIEIERDPTVHFVLSALLNTEKTSLSASEIFAAADRTGLRLTTERIQEMCDRLFIQGVLTFEGSAVRIANGFLKRQARRLRHE